MTTIIGIQGDGWCVVGWDSRISVSVGVDDSKSEVHVLSDSQKKVVQNGPFLIGAAGDLRAINILTHSFSPPTPRASANGPLLDKFISVEFVPALREALEKHGYATSGRDFSGTAEFASELIVCVGGRIYQVDGDYSWISEASGLYSVGSGSPYALGALTATKWGRSTLSARNAILKALSVASKFDPNTGSPFHVAIQYRATQKKDHKKTSVKKAKVKNKLAK